jgi:hypothetical protein
VGNVQFDRSDLNCLEVDEPRASRHDEDIHSMGGSMDDPSGVGQSGQSLPTQAESNAAATTASATVRARVGSPDAVATNTTPIMRQMPVQRGSCFAWTMARPKASPPTTMITPCTVIHTPKNFVTAW